MTAWEKLTSEWVAKSQETLGLYNRHGLYVGGGCYPQLASFLSFGAIGVPNCTLERRTKATETKFHTIRAYTLAKYIPLIINLHGGCLQKHETCSEALNGVAIAESKS
jgi:hypothetical protein